MDELIRLPDKPTQHAVAGVDHYLNDEHARRDSARIEHQMLRLPGSLPA